MCSKQFRDGGRFLVKALDILAVGTPLVAAQFVTEGIPEFRHGVHALLAPTPESFVQLVIDAIRSPDGLQEVGLRGRDMVSERYDWSTHGLILNRIVREAGRSESGGTI